MLMLIRIILLRYGGIRYGGLVMKDKPVIGLVGYIGREEERDCNI